MKQPTANDLQQIKQSLLDGMVSYMNIPGVATGYDSFYTQADVDRCGSLLDEFVAALPKRTSDFAAVMTAIEKTVIALNELNEIREHSLIETDQREAICQFLETAIVVKGIDIDALAASQNCTRHEITDEWRDW